MIVQEGAATRGRLYMDVNDQVRTILDRFEDPVYERDMIAVNRFDGSIIQAHAYVLSAAHHHLLSAERWKLEWFMEVHVQGYVSRCRLFHKAMLSGELPQLVPAKHGGEKWMKPGV